VAGVLGVGEARGGGYVAGAAEEVADLDHPEVKKEEVEKAEHDPDLDDAERDGSRMWTREVLWNARHQPGPEESG
jgi:hypothetical protein